MIYKILWVDDEIDLLKPHVIFLTNKGYEIETINNGYDALEILEENPFDLVFLDENMPGISGIETLSRIKSDYPNIPVIMITKSEEEHIMEEAIGSKIADYLIKPLNPNQILISIKKILDNKRIVSERTTSNYQQEFGKISLELADCREFSDWEEIYRKIIYWELEIDSTEDKGMSEVLLMQKEEANREFCNFVLKNYEGWLAGDASKPLLSHELLENRVFPLLSDVPVILIVIDNLRVDQWEVLEGDISELFEIKEKSFYSSILPTTTAYARNSLFSGLTPQKIREDLPQFWINEQDDGSKNKFEGELLADNLRRNAIDIKSAYFKILQAKEGKALTANYKDLLKNNLNAIVYNFVDMLSHARTDMQMIRELAPDESAYRSLTRTWFEHSSLLDLLRKLSTEDVKVVITTDHGTVRVKKPQKIAGDKSTNTNLRYKTGRNLTFDEKEIFFTREPEKFGLPKANISSAFAFAKQDAFFAYPNNYNHYVNMYRDTFQHGGISLEEMIIPFISMSSK